ncbi:MAG: hypothetical protein U5O39_04645 [Gammaproteobacteria bacterium]|nr:hypothetical protein [Gammaproteobacteria bacterium]
MPSGSTHQSAPTTGFRLHLAEIDIELNGAEVTLARSDDDWVRQTAQLKLRELDSRLVDLARDVLGY